MDFYRIEVERLKNGTYSISPEFQCVPSKDLMIRGGKFYAIWDEENGLWSRSKSDAVRLIDGELKKFADEFLEKNKLLSANDISVKYLRNFIRNILLKILSNCTIKIEKRNKYE